MSRRIGFEGRSRERAPAARAAITSHATPSGTPYTRRPGRLAARRALRLTVLLACAATAAGLAAPAVADAARKRVYYTDYDSGPRMRPAILDGSSTVRAGPFRRWRGWGTGKAKATVRYRSLRTTVVMREIRRCAGRRQYRHLHIYTYEGRRQLGRRKRYVNRACRSSK